MTYLRCGPGSFRFLLAALVFVSHISHFNVGRAAVIMFFMLSGYWVARLYGQRRTPSVFRYLIDRFLRVWPALAVVAIMTVVISVAAYQPAHGSLMSTLALLGVASRRGDVIGVTWSLDVEMQFYLLLPLGLAIISCVPPALKATAAIALVALVTLAGTILLGRGFVSALFYAPAFAAGVAVWHTRWHPGAGVAMASLAVSGALLLGVAAVPAAHWLLIKGPVSPWWFDLTQMVLCLPLVPFLAWNVHQPSSTLDRHLGNLTFPFYLVHFPLVVATAGLTASVSANKFIALGAATVAMFAVYILVDRPFERFRRQIMSASTTFSFRTTTLPHARSAIRVSGSGFTGKPVQQGADTL